MTATRANVHGTAIVLGTRGFLITGPSGVGKSKLALACIAAARQAGEFAALIADDRVDLLLEHGRIVARCPATIQGLIEIRGAGIGKIETAPAAVIDWAVLPVRAPFDPRLPPDGETLPLPLGRALPIVRVPVEDGASALAILRVLLAEKLGF
ncbi:MULTISPECIES: serine kinase [unclassified Ensifer]|uniref:HPr kinase/phosphorylase n=1 Tax=unclassified Ensifer TaxID=2633371 RepID=UPI000813A4ED|nr:MULTISPECIES: serine kinase [unclassified Ensifer]OCO99557.1 serine kinase [Ensifer sp. LC14]OCP07230.1 serine kinase [Ensifer sp. LC13]OCP12609.1 serine kinase [Ensifer sp. LC11]OCP31661.1 serine kinase [Ensifer sp. LC499]